MPQKYSKIFLHLKFLFIINFHNFCCTYYDSAKYCTENILPPFKILSEKLSSEAKTNTVVFTSMQYSEMSHRMTKPSKWPVRPANSDQPEHPPSLIRVFAVHMKKHWVLSYPLSAQRRLWSDWAEAQADLSFSLGAHVILLVLSCSGSNIFVQISKRLTAIIHGFSDLALKRSRRKHFLCKIHNAPHHHIFPIDQSAKMAVKFWAISWENLIMPYANNKSVDFIRTDQCLFWFTA